MSYRLGVDLGTTYTAAALTAERGPPHVLGLGNRAMQIPSVFYVQQDGSVLVGEVAERRGASDPSRLVRESKRRIGDSVPIVVAGVPFTAQALTAKLLRWVVARASQRMGGAPEHVVVTHPANWGPFKLDLMHQVVLLADLASASLMTEPQAAALQYASTGRVAPGARIAVYDLGGGTFDACVLAKTESGFDVLGRPEGIEHLGGIDFDEAVFQHVVSALGGFEAVDVESEEVVLGLSRLRRDCVEAKEALSEEVDAVVPVSIPGLRGPVRITRSELEGLARPALLDTHTALRRAMRSAGVTAEDLSALVLVGGSSRMPIVAQLLEQELGLTTSVDSHPKHDVALGAVQPAPRSSLQPVSPAPAAAQETPDIDSGESAVLGLVEPLGGASQDTVVLPAVLADPRPVREEPRTPPVRPEPPTTPLGPEPAGPVPAPRSRRGLVLVAVLLVVAVSVVGAAVRLLGGSNDNSRTSGGTSADPPNNNGASGGPALPRGPALTDTQMLVTRDRNGVSGIWRADTADGSSKQITASGGEAHSAVLSADRRTFLYMTLDSGTPTLRVMATDGTGDRALLSDPSVCPDPARGAWSPANGESRIVLVCGTPGQQVLKASDLDGSNPVRLASGVQAYAPSVNPQGTRVVFVATASNETRGGRIEVVDIGGGQPSQVTDGVGYVDSGPAWSPDGALIAMKRAPVEGDTVGNGDIWSMRPDGSNRRNLTNDPEDELAPTWSPDGSRIAFISRGSGVAPGAHVWTVPATGGASQEMWPDQTGREGLPAWTRR